MSLVEARGLVKHFKVLNRQEGLAGSIKDLFSSDYRLAKAVDDISFSIEEGEMVGFLGPNGAGKSTTIKMLVGALQPSSGYLQVRGLVPSNDRKRYVKNIGIVFGQRSQLWWDIPVIESFKVLREIYEVNNDVYERNMELFRGFASFKNVLGTPVRNLSLGQRTLCDILAAFLHNPAIVFLDEPTIGLDVVMKSKIREMIRELNRVNKTTVLLTSHDTKDVESLCRRIIMIDKGKIIYDGETSQFHTLYGAYRNLKIRLSDESLMGNKFSLVMQELTSKINSLTVRQDGDGWINISFNEDEFRLVEAFKFLVNRVDIADIKIEEVELESLIKKAYSETAA